METYFVLGFLFLFYGNIKVLINKIWKHKKMKENFMET